MDLFLAAVQVVPMLFIPLFLDRRTAGDNSDRPVRRLRLFHLIVAALGLVAFSISVYVIGSEPEPASWMRSVVTTALACAMAALTAQILLRILRPTTRSQGARE